jgi:hypothetical protein
LNVHRLLVPAFSKYLSRFADLINYAEEKRTIIAVKYELIAVSVRPDYLAARIGEI